MGYHYSNPKREHEVGALPNVEVFRDDDGQDESEHGWFYAFGFPGCLYDSEPTGPFATEAEALAAAREDGDDE